MLEAVVRLTTTQPALGDRGRVVLANAAPANAAAQSQSRALISDIPLHNGYTNTNSRLVRCKHGCCSYSVDYNCTTESNVSKRRLNSLSVAAQLELNLLLRITRTFRDKFPPIRSFTSTQTEMDKLTIISGCLFLAADIFAIASVANPDWINTGESAVIEIAAYVPLPFLLKTRMKGN
ncbi:modulator of smoothened protein [Tachysurus ichikawai]